MAFTIPQLGHIFRKRFFADRVSGYKKHVTDTVPGYKKYVTDTVSGYKKYITDTVMDNFLHWSEKFIHFSRELLDKLG